MSAAENQQIDFDGYLVTHYTKLPNMAFEELEPYAYKLLAVYLDTIRQAEKGVCFKSNETIAKQLGCSVNRMKKARQELVKLGYIVVALGTETTSRVTLQLSKMWTKNHEIESKKQEERRQEKQSQGGYQDLTPPYQDLTGGVSQFDTKEKESNKTQLRKEKTTPLPPQDDKTLLEKKKQAVKPNPIFDWVALNCFNLEPHSPEIKRNSGRIGKIVSYLSEKQATLEQLDRFKAWYKRTMPPDFAMPTRDDKFSTHYKKFLDSSMSASQAAKIIYAEPVELPGVSDGVVTFNRPPKKEQAS